MSEASKQLAVAAATAPPRRSRRITEVDAARGAAMFFVCLAHSASAQLPGATSTFLVTLVAMVASPSFMLISGAMLGYLYGRRPESFSRTRLTLIDKALFLLIIGHLLLMGAPILGGRPIADGVRLIYITDTIAVSIIVGSFVITWLSMRGRLALVALLFVMSWVLVEVWQPGSAAALAIKHAFVGAHASEEPFWVYSFTLIPWFSLYLAGTVLGETMGAWKGVPAVRRWAVRCIWLGISVVGAGLLVRIVGGLVVPLVDVEAVSDATRLVQKVPPSASYMLFYSGCALLMVAVVFVMHRSTRLEWLTDALRVVGKTSLFVFILQGYIYFGILAHFVPTTVAGWAVQFLVSLIVIVLLARAWLNRRGNRFITVGLPVLYDRMEKERRSMAPA